MRLLVTAIFYASVLMAFGCGGSNFLIYKDAKHYYVTNKSDNLRKILCDSGDLAKIARDAQLPATLQQELFASICTTNKVKERVLAVLESMTKEQRTALKLAFQTNGYQINTIANC